MFRVGDRVILSGIGTITSIRAGEPFPIKVTWDNGVKHALEYSSIMTAWSKGCKIKYFNLNNNNWLLLENPIQELDRRGAQIDEIVRQIEDLNKQLKALGG